MQERKFPEGLKKIDFSGLGYERKMHPVDRKNLVEMGEALKGRARYEENPILNLGHIDIKEFITGKARTWYDASDEEIKYDLLVPLGLVEFDMLQELKTFAQKLLTQQNPQGNI